MFVEVDFIQLCIMKFDLKLCVLQSILLINYEFPVHKHNYK